jgi:hypothetical protein
MPLPLSQIGGAVKSFVKPIGQAFQGLGGGQKAAIGLTGGLLAGKALSGGQRNTTINKLSFDEISENAFKDELQKIAKKTHPVSKSQERWAFAAEERGELPKGKAEKWAKRAKGKHLPEKTASDEITDKAFIEELNKLASEKGLKKLIKKIHKTHPEAFAGIGAK